MFTEIPLADSPDARRNREKSITNHNTSPNRSPRPLWPLGDLGVLQEYQRSCCRSFQSRSTANERIEWCHFSICRGELRCELWLTVCLTPWTMKKSKHRFESMYKPKDPADSDSFSTFPQVCIPSLGLCICRVQSSEIAAVYVGSGKPGSPGASMTWPWMVLDGPWITATTGTTGTDKISWVSDVSEAREAHGFTEGSTDRLMYWPGRQVTRELRWIAGCFWRSARREYEERKQGSRYKSFGWIECVQENIKRRSHGRTVPNPLCTKGQLQEHDVLNPRRESISVSSNTLVFWRDIRNQKFLGGAWNPEH